MRTVFDVMIEKFAALEASASSFLVSGGAKDFAEYREVCGRIRGLRLAIDETQALAKHHLEDKDDD
jgi:hypothetical protein